MNRIKPTPPFPSSTSSFRPPISSFRPPISSFRPPISSFRRKPESRISSARFALLHGGARARQTAIHSRRRFPPPSCVCARTALNLYWIPAFAGMAKKRCGPGAAAPNPAIPAQQSVQKPCGHPANKAYPAIPAKAGIQHMKRALRAPLRCRGRKRKRDSGFRRNDGKKPE